MEQGEGAARLRTTSAQTILLMANGLFLLRDKVTMICRETQIVDGVLKLLGHRSVIAISAYLEDEVLEVLGLACRYKV